MALAISTDDDTTIVGRPLRVDGLDKELLKDDSLLRNGIGRLYKVVDGQIVASFDTTGIVDYEDGAVEFFGTPVEVTPHPATTVQTFSLL